jgi:hypothetical protein
MDGQVPPRGPPPALTSCEWLSKLLGDNRQQGAAAMPSFLKNPKVIVGAIVVLWVAYVISNNLEKSVDFRLLPFNILTLQLRVSGLVVASALFGVLATIVIQFLWKRRSKNAVSPASVTSSSTAQ